MAVAPAAVVPVMPAIAKSTTCSESPSTSLSLVSTLPVTAMSSVTETGPSAVATGSSFTGTRLIATDPSDTETYTYQGVPVVALGGAYLRQQTFEDTFERDDLERVFTEVLSGTTIGYYLTWQRYQSGQPGVGAFGNYVPIEVQ